MNDNRLIVRLSDYWNRIKKDDLIPDFRKNNPASIEDLWEQCFVLSIVPPDLFCFKYEYLGEKIQKIYGSDLTGTIVNIKNKQFPNSVIVPKLQSINILSDMKPSEDSGQMPHDSGKIIKYRTVLLPFGNESKGLTHIVVGVSFREF